nr:MAG TPA: hypothetical protein [Caudoviricetes sp.]
MQIGTNRNFHIFVTADDFIGCYLLYKLSK